MNATNKPLWVSQTVDVQPTPEVERRNPLGSPAAKSPAPAPATANPLDQWVRGQRSEASSADSPNTQGLPKRPRWLRKVLAWLEGHWGKAPEARP